MPMSMVAHFYFNPYLFLPIYEELIEEGHIYIAAPPIFIWLKGNKKGTLGMMYTRSNQWRMGECRYSTL
jgi:DNA gyrase/topoisomerase IV subunit B